MADPWKWPKPELSVIPTDASPLFLRMATGIPWATVEQLRKWVFMRHIYRRYGRDY